MKKIGVAGLQRELIKQMIESSAPGCFETFICNDLEAASKVKSGQLDYYIGACNTGAGAALSIAIAIIGFNKCCTIALAGRARQGGGDRQSGRRGEGRLWPVGGEH